MSHQTTASLVSSQAALRWIRTLGLLQVHGAFAGYTGITVGLVNTHYAYMPIPEVIRTAREVDPNGRMWHRLLTATGQPDFINFDDYTSA